MTRGERDNTHPLQSCRDARDVLNRRDEHAESVFSGACGGTGLPCRDCAFHDCGAVALGCAAIREWLFPGFGH